VSIASIAEMPTGAPVPPAPQVPDAKRRRVAVLPAAHHMPDPQADAASFANAVLAGPVVDDHCGARLLEKLRQARDLVQSLQTKPEIAVAELGVLLDAINALLEREVAIEMSPSWRTLPHHHVETALGQLSAQDADRHVLHELGGRLRELRTESVLAPAAMPELLDYLLIVCSPSVSPLPEAPIEAHAIASIVEAAGMSVLVLHNGLLATVNQVFMKRRPRVAIFIGHADARTVDKKLTLGLTDDAGRLLLMQRKTIVDVLSCASDRLELLIVNGCCSEDFCEEASRRFRVPTMGWRTRTADVAAKLWSIGTVERLVRDSSPLSRSDVHAAFEHGTRAVKVVVKRSRTGRQWAIPADPDVCEQLSDGALAAGVPVLLAPLPAKQLRGVPPLPILYHERTEVLKAQRQLLIGGADVCLAPANIIATGSAAPGGAGKSTMAVALAKDVCVQSYFDLIVWLIFGQMTKVESVLLELAELVGVPVIEQTNEQLQRLISAMFQGKHVLLISDDVWTLDQSKGLRWLTAEGGKLVHLITTRNHALLPGGQVQHLPPWEGNEAKLLFEAHLGRELKPSEVEEAGCLQRDFCGGLPVRIVASAVLTRTVGVAAALQHMRVRREMREAPDLNPVCDYHDDTLEDALEGTLRFLDQNPPRHIAKDTLHKRCLMTAILPADVNAPLWVVTQLWGVERVEAERCAKVLADFNLMCYHRETQTISLIDPHRDCFAAMGRADLAQWHADLLCTPGFMRRCFEADVLKAHHLAHHLAHVWKHDRGQLVQDIMQVRGCEEALAAALLCLRDDQEDAVRDWAHGMMFGRAAGSDRILDIAEVADGRDKTSAYKAADEAADEAVDDAADDAADKTADKAVGSGDTEKDFSLQLTDTDAVVRKAAARIVPLLRNTDACVRQAAVRAFERLDESVLAAHAGAIIALLTDAPVPPCRVEPEALVKPVVRRCLLEPADSSPEARSIVGHRLRTSWSQSPSPPTLPARATCSLSDACVREAAIRAFERLNASLLTAHVGAIVALLRNADAGVREAAVRAFERLDASVLATHAGAIVSLHWHADSGVRKVAMQAFKCLDDSARAHHTQTIAEARELHKGLDAAERALWCSE